MHYTTIDPQKTKSKPQDHALHQLLMTPWKDKHDKD
jgi:hypothetical protein